MEDSRLKRNGDERELITIPRREIDLPDSPDAAAEAFALVGAAMIVEWASQRLLKLFQSSREYRFGEREFRPFEG